MSTYSSTPDVVAQKKCPHSLRNKERTECSLCGARKTPSGRWEHLIAADFYAYVNDTREAR